MSVDLRIVKLEKLTDYELEMVKNFTVIEDEKLLGCEHDWDDFNPYSILRFHLKDTTISKLPKGLLTEKVVKIKQVNTEQMYKYLGFSDESIKEGKVKFRWMSGRKICYDDGGMEAKISIDEEDRFIEEAEIPCLLVREKVLFDSDETTLCVSTREAKNKLLKFYPGFETYCYEKINNEMLAKAEIPFLIYERNSDKCFIYISD